MKGGGTKQSESPPGHSKNVSVNFNGTSYLQIHCNSATNYNSPGGKTVEGKGEKSISQANSIVRKKKNTSEVR